MFFCSDPTSSCTSKSRPCSQVSAKQSSRCIIAKRQGCHSKPSANVPWSQCGNVGSTASAGYSSPWHVSASPATLRIRTSSLVIVANPRSSSFAQSSSQTLSSQMLKANERESDKIFKNFGNGDDESQDERDVFKEWPEIEGTPDALFRMIQNDAVGREAWEEMRGREEDHNEPLPKYHEIL
ncbi:hypothetical protein BC829DRAFT_79981 [Chytridium lagenaria]|nr:hypothetical protein BC829DRAFT_79981 [Chytridium lagenaria]